MKQRCFTIMPFKAAFNDIEEIIREAVEACNMDYVRGDLSKRSGSIMAQVVHEIGQAAIVIADISEHNPNVFYELGVAHQIKGPDRVVILTQHIDPTQIFDLHQFRQIVYTHDAVGRKKLREALPEHVRQATAAHADHATWSMVRGRLPRTRMIVRDLKQLVGPSGTKRLDGTIIRIAAGLGSLAISDLEPHDPKDDAEYIGELRKERNLLRKALCQGAKLRAVLNPPRRFTQALTPARMEVRYNRMIRLLEGGTDNPAGTKAAVEDLLAMKQCEFTLSPVAMSNMFIIGNSVVYEGMKRGGTGGFEVTHIESDSKEIDALIDQFDTYFTASRMDLKHAHPPDGCVLDLLREFLEEAMSLQKRRGESNRAEN